MLQLDFFEEDTLVLLLKEVAKLREDQRKMQKALYGRMQDVEKSFKKKTIHSISTYDLFDTG